MSLTELTTESFQTLPEGMTSLQLADHHLAFDDWIDSGGSNFRLFLFEQAVPDDVEVRQRASLTIALLGCTTIPVSCSLKWLVLASSNRSNTSVRSESFWDEFRLYLPRTYYLHALPSSSYIPPGALFQNRCLPSCLRPRHPIIVAMNGDHGLFGIGDLVANPLDQCAEFLRDCVGPCQECSRCGPAANNRLNNLVEERGI